MTHLTPRAPDMRVLQPGLLALGLCLVLLGWAPPAAAQYKWKDANGQTHVSDMPPPADVPERNVLQRPPAKRPPVPAVAGIAGGNATDVKLANNTPNSNTSNNGTPSNSPGSTASAGNGGQPTTAASKAGIDPELDKRRQRQEQEARQKAVADEQRVAAQRHENCQRARQQLALYQSGQRLVRPNAAGERVVVDDATRNAEQQLARRVIDSDCH